MNLESVGNTGNPAGPEKIATPAIVYEGEFFRGGNHGEALDMLLMRHPQADLTRIKQGFMTSLGRFVSREEAQEIAARAEQLSARAAREDGRDLHSEDLKRAA